MKPPMTTAFDSRPQIAVQDPIMTAEGSRKNKEPLEMEYNQFILITAILKNS